MLFVYSDGHSSVSFLRICLRRCVGLQVEVRDEDDFGSPTPYSKKPVKVLSWGSCGVDTKNRHDPQHLIP